MSSRVRTPTRTGTRDPDALRSVAVSSCGLDGDDAAALAEAVGIDLEDDVEDDVATSSSSAMDLDLSDNPGMGCRGASALAPLVARGAVASLDLENCGVGESGAEALAEALASPRCALRRLNLSRNFIGATGVRRVARARLGAPRAFGTTVERGRAAPRAPRESQRVRVRGRDGVGRGGGDVRRVRASRNFGRDDERHRSRGGGGVGARDARRVGRAGASRVAIGGESRRRGGARALARACATPSDSNLSPSDARDAHSRFRATGSGGRGGGGVGDVATPRGRLARVARPGPLRQRHRRMRRRDSRHGGRNRRLRRRGGGRRRRRTRRSRRRERGRRRRRERGRRRRRERGRRRRRERGLPPTALSSLADDLASARSLRRLDLGYNSLGDAGRLAVAAAVARAAATATRDEDEDERGGGASSSERGGGASSSERGGGASSSERGGGVELDLQRNSIGNAGALALAEALGVADAPGRRVARVDLRSNAVGEAGLSALDALVAAGRVASNYMPPRWGPRERVADMEAEENIAGGGGGVVAATA